ncbi:hypothetical protein Taro_032552, partial [Colocasia esculenta]|nr:hypothetical protein [Colocasia esculenta]
SHMVMFFMQEENSENYEIKDSGSDQFNTVDDCPKTDESDIVDAYGEANAVQDEQHGQLEDEQIQKDTELMEQQYIPRRPYQSQRGGGRGGGGGGGGSGRRGFGNGRGSRGGRGGGGGYQNGRSQYYDPGYYPRNYYNTRGRGGRSGAPAMHNHAGAAHGGRVPDNIELGASP